MTRLAQRIGNDLVANFHQYFAKVVLPFAPAHAPESIAPVVALDYLRCAGIANHIAERVVSELDADEFSHYPQFDLIPICPDGNLTPGSFGFGGRGQSGYINPLYLLFVACLGSLIGVLHRWVYNASVRNGAGVEIAEEAVLTSKGHDGIHKAISYVKNNTLTHWIDQVKGDAV